MTMKKGAIGTRPMALALGLLVWFGAAQGALAAIFTGNDPNNNLFSTVGNWDTFPAATATVVSYFSNTSAGHPAQLDAAFNGVVTSLGNFTIAPNASATAYVEVLGGATLRSVNLYVGNNNQSLRGGVLTLDAGSALLSATVNNGTLFLGSNGVGRVVAKDGLVGFGFANVILGVNGTLAYEVGANSVSTFTSTKNSAAANLLLNGVIELDLAAGPSAGTYTLIQSSHVDTAMTGLFANWLAGEGGSFSGTGSYDGSKFKVLNGGTTEWMLSSADGGSTLNFTVIPEPATLGLLMASTGMLVLFRRLRL